MRRGIFLLQTLFFALIAALPFSEFPRAVASERADATEFSIVAANDPLQHNLRVLRNADWTNSSAAETPLTRYEIAIETAKALITARSHYRADANWSRNVTPESLRALRALCNALQSELANFDVDIPAALSLLNDMIANSANATSVNATPRPSTPAPPVTGLRSKPQPVEAAPVTPSLSQRLRVHSALDSLARDARDPFASHLLTSSGAAAGNIRKLRAGATFELSENLRVRADFERQSLADTPATAQNLREFLEGTTLSSSLRNTRSVGAGADWSLTPGIKFSGGVARVDGDLNQDDGLRFEGGVGLSGWQNRVALSAHLSRLVPEDSMALGVTAARLNLGVEVTSQVQLKLMYQQMFGAGETGQGNHRFGGGLDFSF